MNDTIFVTGAAGFIGFHVSRKLIKNGFYVLGFDNINDYYDIDLKVARKKNLAKYAAQLDVKKKYNFKKIDISNKKDLFALFKKCNFDIVVNLAAQAGVRYSIDNPQSYVESNLVGFVNIVECCREFKIKHLVFASSSSVYGMNKDQPFKIQDKTDFPISLYAATKKSNELLAFSYSHLYKIPTTGLRFFTVYGPFGRPDMAYFKFTKSIIEDKPIDVYNNGNMKRDFTYIDDIVDGVIRTTNKIPGLSEKWNSHTPSFHDSDKPWRVFNIANGTPVPLMEFIETIEAKLKKKAVSNLLPLQPGDVPETHADISLLSEVTGYLPKTSVKEGVSKFVDWYLSFYGE